jgi:hypothetical protein
MNRDGAPSIAVLQEIFNNSNELKVLETDFTYIHANFSFLSQSVTELEKTTNLFSKTIKEMNNAQDKLNGSETDTLCPPKNICSCFSKNKGLKVVSEIFNVY